jgi:protein-S-isoprenylcysteine O-methyltransferase Ste14
VGHPGNGVGPGVTFEEYELELRLGQTYLDYKQRVHFLLPGWFRGEN